MRYEGKLYRALNPVYGRAPLSGRGAALYGGRFNPRGMPALYCSLSIMTALREANQAGNLQPTMLVSYIADIDAIFDTRDNAALADAGMTRDALASKSWRDEMARSGEARSQAFASRLAEAGYNGLLARSFAAGTTDDDLNLVLWTWGDQPPARLVVIDDENRLGLM